MKLIIFVINIYTAMKKIILILIAIIAPAASLMSQSSGLPLLGMSPTKIAFGSIDFKSKKCISLVMKNIGDTILRIYSADNINYPFSGKIPTPTNLNKSDSIVVNICYNPQKIGIDSQRVFFRADTRLSNSIALVFDVSSSMRDNYLSDGSNRLTAAHDAGISFINSMLTTSIAYDEAAVFTFSGDFVQAQGFTSNKTMLRNAVPTAVRNTGTAFYNALYYTIDSLKKRPFKKVIVALTDGEDNKSLRANFQKIIPNAVANKILIFTIGVGSSLSDDTLRMIAQGTGGEFFKTNSKSGLLDIYQKIFSMLSKNVELYFDITGSCSGPFSELSCPGDIEPENGDTITIPVYVNRYARKITPQDTFMLQLSFNRNVLHPLPDTGITYTNSGILVKRDNNKTDLDSLPLTQVRFTAMLGDSPCTTIHLDSLVWNDGEFQTVISKPSCEICVSVCKAAGNRLFLSSNEELLLMQNSPNPFNEKTTIQFSLVEEGFTRLYICN
ncbi:MAG: hypothetical protein QG635_981, partial [Bacteroidota bacterium]|nr:hypothetical protein [Bacteroidota bacterium]